jgi:hypothetical protein
MTISRRTAVEAKLATKLKLERERRKQQEQLEERWAEFEADGRDDWEAPSRDNNNYYNSGVSDDALCKTAPNAELDVQGILMVCVEEIALEGPNGCTFPDLWQKLPRRGIPVPSFQLQELLTTRLQEAMMTREINPTQITSYVRDVAAAAPVASKVVERDNKNAAQRVVASTRILQYATCVSSLGLVRDSYHAYLQEIGRSRGAGVFLDALNNRLKARNLKTTDRYVAIDVLASHGVIVKAKAKVTTSRRGVSSTAGRK